MNVSRRPAATAAITVWLLAVLLSGCVSVPTAGPVEPGRLASGSPSARVEIEAAPPAPDASPALVVEGFLHAMSNGQGGYDIARQYLAGTARENWRPDQGVLIYDGSNPLQVAGDRVVLDSPLSGTLADDGSYTHTQQTYRIDFGLARDDNGQWRITNPPNGLLISQYLFEKFYRRYNIYFFDSSAQTLVPDPIYLPRVQQSSAAVMRALLRGPTRWLAPAVFTALPAGAELAQPMAVRDGVIEVAFDAQLAALGDAERGRVAAQVVWTLGQLDNVTGVRLLSGGAPLAVPERSADGVIPISSFTAVNPIANADRELYVATPAGIATVSSDAQVPAEPIAGPCGRLNQPVQALAVAQGPVNGQGGNGPDQARQAVVSQGQLLICSAQNETAVAVPGLPAGVRSPQFTRFDHLWVAADTADGSRLYQVRDGQARPIAAPGMSAGELRAFRVSPDGSRIAMIRRIGSDWRLGVARIVRGGDQGQAEVRVEAWQRVDLARSSEPVAVGWSDATTLLVLASDAARTPAKPYLVRQDGADLRLIGTGDWNPAQLAVQPSDGGVVAAVVSKSGDLWRYQDDDRWPFVMDGLGTAAYQS